MMIRHQHHLFLGNLLSYIISKSASGVKWNFDSVENWPYVSFFNGFWSIFNVENDPCPLLNYSTTCEKLTPVENWLTICRPYLNIDKWSKYYCEICQWSYIRNSNISVFLWWKFIQMDQELTTFWQPTANNFDNELLYSMLLPLMHNINIYLLLYLVLIRGSYRSVISKLPATVTSPDQ
jgi:hypothetical protein